MIKADVKIIKADLTKYEFIYLVPLSDLHIEEPQTDREAIRGYIDWIKRRKNAFTLLNGDLFSAITKQSAADIYDMGEPGKPIELVTPDAGLVILEDLLKPIADRILAACAGGHELKNLLRAVGSDYVWQLMRNLGREHVYSRDGGVLLMKTKPLTKKDDIFFSAVYTHGWGGARTRGAKIRKLEYLAQGLDADMYIMSHDHTQNLTRDNYLTVPSWNCDRVVVHRKLLVSTGGFRGYAGYPFRSGFQPADLGTPRIRVGKKIESDGTIRKDIHASI